MSVSIKGDENVLIENIDKRACQDSENATFHVSEMKQYPLENGFICQGDILPLNKVVVFSLNSSGKDLYKLNKDEEQELKDLQKESINASMKGSKWNIFLTFILVIITGFYAWVANRTWSETKKSNIPLVSAKLDPLGTSSVVLKILNIGNSTARSINLKYKTEPNGPTGEWIHHVLQPNDFARLVVEDSSLIDFLGKYRKIMIESCYEDIHKEKYKDSFTINLIEYNKSVKDNLWLLETSLKEDIEQISKKVKELVEILKFKNLKIDIKNIDLNPNKLKGEIKLYEKLLNEKKRSLEKLKKKYPKKE